MGRVRGRPRAAPVRDRLRSSRLDSRALPGDTTPTVVPAAHTTPGRAAAGSSRRPHSPRRLGAEERGRAGVRAICAGAGIVPTASRAPEDPCRESGSRPSWGRFGITRAPTPCFSPRAANPGATAGGFAGSRPQGCCTACTAGPPGSPAAPDGSRAWHTASARQPCATRARTPAAASPASRPGRLMHLLTAWAPWAGWGDLLPHAR
jgi:hypothetical protein